MALAWAVDEDAGYGEAQHAPPRLYGSGRGPATGEVAEPAAVGAPSPFSILVADDEASLRTTLSAILGSAGHRVVEAEDGQAALRLLHEQPFDVLILDLHMPKPDGVTILRQIEVPPPVVIVYSAFALFSLDAVRDEVGAKIFRFLQKPVPPGEIIAAVNDATAEFGR